MIKNTKKNKGLKSFGMQIQMWQDCNLDCIHCWRDAKFEGLHIKEKVISNKVKNLFLHLRNKGYGYFWIHLTGGEIFLYPDKIFYFLDVMKDIDENWKAKSQCNLLTNGTLLNRKMYDRLMPYKKFISLQISIDGDRKTHDKIRGEGSFMKSVEAIKLGKKLGFKIRVQMVITSENWKQIPYIIHYFDLLGIKSIGFRKVLIVGGSKTKMKESYIDRNNYLIKSYKLLYRFLNKKNISSKIDLGCDSVSVRNFYPLLSGLSGTCGVHDKRIMGIEPNGDVQLCPRLPIKIGNIIEDDIIDLFENKYDLKYNKGSELNDNCKKCDSVDICKGGDLCEEYSYYSEINKKQSLLCNID